MDWCKVAAGERGLRAGGDTVKRATTIFCALAVAGLCALAGVISPRMAALYRLEGNATDSGGAGVNGTIVGSPTLSTGKFGRCYTFSVENFITAGNVHTHNEMTISAWVNSSNPAAGKTLNNIVTKFSGFTLGSYILRINESGVAELLVNDGGAVSISSATVLQSNTWYHVAATIKTGDTRLYVNGISEATSAVTFAAMSSSSVPFNIGNRFDKAEWGMTGMIDEVRIYTAALSERDVRRVMLGLEPLEAR